MTAQRKYKLRSGTLLLELGSIYQTNYCGPIEIVEMHNANKYSVKFVNTGTIKEAQKGNILKGTVRDPYCALLHGVGYIGEGKYRSLDIIGPKKYKNTDAYKAWGHILSRCYGTGSLRETNCCYKDSTMQESWWNFQTFAEWYYTNKPSCNYALQIDKDLKVPGNKVYGPDTCTFVPSAINSLFTGWLDNRDLPRGVTVSKLTGRYIAKTNHAEGGLRRQIHIGTYDTIEEARLAYIDYKATIATDVANRYKDILDPVVYNNLVTDIRVFIPN